MSDQRRDYAVLISLAMREEAEVAAAALRADGIDAFLSNTNHSGIEWFYVHAFGGVQIMVPRQEPDEAKSALRERVREHAGDFPEERIRRRDRWKVWLLGAYPYGPVMLAWATLAWLPSAPLVPDLAWMIRSGLR